MDRIIDPAWLGLDTGCLDSWERELSAEGFRAIIMFCLTQMRKGPCPPGDAAMQYYLGASLTLARPVMREVDRFIDFTPEGGRGFLWIEKKRDQYMGRSEQGKGMAGRRWSKPGSGGGGTPPPPAAAYEMPQYAGPTQGAQKVMPQAMPQALPDLMPQAMQKERVEGTRAPAPSSLSLGVPVPGGATALDPSSEGAGKGGPPSSGSGVLTPKREAVELVCPKCGSRTAGWSEGGSLFPAACKHCKPLTWNEVAGATQPEARPAQLAPTMVMERARAGEGEYVETRPDHDPVSLPVLPRSKGRGAVAEPVARAVLREVQASLRTPGRNAAKAKKPASQDAPGRGVGKSVSLGHGGNARAGSGLSRARALPLSKKKRTAKR